MSEGKVLGALGGNSGNPAAGANETRSTVGGATTGAAPTNTGDKAPGPKGPPKGNNNNTQRKPQPKVANPTSAPADAANAGKEYIKSYKPYKKRAKQPSNDGANNLSTEAGNKPAVSQPADSQPLVSQSVVKQPAANPTSTESAAAPGGTSGEPAKSDAKKNNKKKQWSKDKLKKPTGANETENKEPSEMSNVQEKPKPKPQNIASAASDIPVSSADASQLPQPEKSVQPAQPSPAAQKRRKRKQNKGGVNANTTPHNGASPAASDSTTESATPATTPTPASTSTAAHKPQHLPKFKPKNTKPKPNADPASGPQRNPKVPKAPKSRPVVDSLQQKTLFNTRPAPPSLRSQSSSQAAIKILQRNSQTAPAPVPPELQPALAVAREKNTKSEPKLENEPITKLMVRLLPPLMTEEQFAEIVAPALEKKTNWFYYVPGKVRPRYAIAGV